MISDVSLLKNVLRWVYYQGITLFFKSDQCYISLNIKASLQHKSKMGAIFISTFN